MGKKKVIVDYSVFVENLKKDEAVILYITETVVKSFYRKMGKNFGFVDLKRGKYATAMQSAVANVVGTVAPALQKARAMIDEKLLIRLLYDYLSALREAFNRRGIGSFYLVQIGGVYALEVFQNWIMETFDGVDEYVKSITRQMSKKDKKLIRKIEKKKKSRKVVGRIMFRNLFRRSDVPGVYVLDI